MKMQQRVLAWMMSLILLVTSVLPAAAGVEQAMITIAPGSAWQGSVYGDVGGQDKINASNFEITEGTNDSVVLRSSNNVGKIASASEGIAYYYQAVPEDGDYELSATARVDSWTANNQVSFGVMLRDQVAVNRSFTVTDVTYAVYFGDYVAVGALDQKMTAFYHQNNAQVKAGLDFPSAPAPGKDNTYELSIRKQGSQYIVRIGSDIRVLDNITGTMAYAGLYTARNTKVTFTNVKLHVQPKVNLGDWQYSAFGSDTSGTKNPAPVVSGGSVKLTASGGKIDSSNEGISYYYKEVPANASFELRAKAKVNTFNSDSSKSSPNQKSFGLMIKDQINVSTSNYAAVGALDLAMKGFYKLGTQNKLEAYSGVNAPAASEEYDLRIRKNGDVYVLTVNGKSETVILPNLMTGGNYAGLYVARDADITFSQISLHVDGRAPTQLLVDSSSMKTTYFVSENLELNGLKVKALYANGRSEWLSSSEYLLTGFDSSKAGTNQAVLHFNGITVPIAFQIIPMQVTALEIPYTPAKTTYYPGDLFDPEGLVVIGEYNHGFSRKELAPEQYAFSIPGATVSGATYTFDTPGVKQVTVISTDTPTTKAAFDVNVKDAALLGLEVRQAPQKTLYYLGDQLDLAGLVVYAKYSDGASVRLTQQEYTVSPLDTTTAGTKQLLLAHKGTTVPLTVTVKARELVGVEVAQYPKTTYTVGEAFSPTGLAVSKVYDSGDREPLSDADYTVDDSQFNSAQAGTYEVRIVPKAAGLSGTVLKTVVREPVTYEWKTIRFGQSTSSTNNTVTVKSPGVVEVVALEGGGKVTGDHDGISFYYVELDALKDNFVLSADIQVKAYAKTPHDGQESFGIMARDAIGKSGDSAVFASNIAAVGGYSGGTTKPNGTQMFVRTGVESSDGSGSQGIQNQFLSSVKPEAQNTHPAAPYRLTLAKTNTGFTGKLNQGQEVLYYEPDILKTQNDKMYVGFYAARLATIEVSNIKLQVTAAEADAPKVEAPKLPVTPNYNIVSLAKTSSSSYSLKLKSNVDGTVTVKQGNNVIAQDVPVVAGQLASIPATLAADSSTNFSITLLPADTQELTSYDKIIKNFTVTMKTYVPDGDIYVSPAGTSTGTGTQGSPLDLDTAIDFVRPGQRIILQDGRYIRSSKLEIKKYNDGTAQAKKSLVAAPDARPILDFDKKSEGVVLSGNYWHVQGIDVTRSAGNTKGFTVGGSYNIVENSRFYENGDTGLQISRTDESATRAEWPAYNLILNSTSFDNRDPSDNNADGFAAKLTVGEGNVFRGTIAHNNIDDGWDLYTKAGTGAIGVVLIEDSIAYNNGTLTNGTVGAGDKNGFKLGGEGIHVPHIIRNSIAFGNGAYGFASNSNPGVIAYNNIAFNNAKGNLNFVTYSHIPTDFKLNDFVSYQKDYTAKDNYPANLNSASNYLFNGKESVNSLGVKLTDANFVSLTPVIPFTRDASGSIQRGDFLTFLKPTVPGTTPDTTDTDQGEAPVVPSAPPAGGGSVPGTSAPSNEGTGLTVSPVLAGEIAVGKLEQSKLNEAFSNAKANDKGEKTVAIDVPKVEGAKAYGVSVPTPVLSTAGGGQKLAVSTEVAGVVLPGNMLSNTKVGAQEVVLRITPVESSSLPSGVQGEIGARPVVSLSLEAEGQPVSYNNPMAPVTVAIPYRPTAQELANPEFITVWYIDHAGKQHPVPSGKYDAISGKVTFTTTHFSTYAVAYVKKSFGDLSNVEWGRKAIEVLASKGVIQGTSEHTYTPEKNITRADFTILLIKALGLTATEGSSFADVTPDDYYYEGVAAAKQLGIVNGRENNRFEPNASITRQDMIVMAARALRAAGKLEASANADAAINSFVDLAAVASYAVSDLAVMAKAGLVQGDDRKQVQPLANTTRAEAAALIYRLYNK